MGEVKLWAWKEATPSTTWTPNLRGGLDPGQSMGALPTSILRQPQLRRVRERHSTFSRAAAEVLTAFTGDAYFRVAWGHSSRRQGILGLKTAPASTSNCSGPPTEMPPTNAAVSNLRRIHPTFDDVPGRLMGIDIGLDAFQRAARFTEATRPKVHACPPRAGDLPRDLDNDGFVTISDVLILLGDFGAPAHAWVTWTETAW